ncbi:hypothetical protein [Marinobacter nauticus]|uniref:Uncharacterized protein n=1 Tax=Marinobacter nauticus TaxID=2743 RepID=A0A368UWJ0_MARNT|nr:hypothetical protein [Marinobacter nauticus]RBP69597.1 hypothetical protein DET64_11239 [Marinobacter nauticus]RCW31241.1 hypothetical protein DET51_11239 [Marinobacter nauticus]
MIDEFNAHHVMPDPEDTLKGPELPLRLDLNNQYYQARVSQLDKLKAIAERHNLPQRPGLDDAERVMVEITAASGGNSILANFCADHVLKWYSDKNPHRIDLAFSTCLDYDVEPTPTLIKLMAKVATARLNGELSGTPDRLMKENIKGQAFRIILNLVHAGDTLQSATSKAAKWCRDNYPDQKTPKASSLSKDYEKAFRKPDGSGQTQEQRYFASWDKWKTDEAKAFWGNAKDNMPLADSELTGARRR